MYIRILLGGQEGTYLKRDIIQQYKMFIGRSWVTHGLSTDGTFASCLNLAVNDFPVSGRKTFLARRLLKAYSLIEYNEINPIVEGDIHLKMQLEDKAKIIGTMDASWYNI